MNCIRSCRCFSPSCRHDFSAAGKRVDSAEALRLGLVDHAVDAGEAYLKALEIAREIAQGAPLALRLAKAAVSQASGACV